jgi:hypothetical protein
MVKLLTLSPDLVAARVRDILADPSAMEGRRQCCRLSLAKEPRALAGGPRRARAWVEIVLGREGRLGTRTIMGRSKPSSAWPGTRPLTVLTQNSRFIQKIAAATSKFS